MKKLLIIWMLLAAALFSGACAGKEEEGVNVYQVYYVSNSETKVEMHPHAMEAETPEKQLGELMECLSTDPEKLEYKAPFAMGFRVLGMSLEE